MKKMNFVETCGVETLVNLCEGNGFDKRNLRSVINKIEDAQDLWLLAKMTTYFQYGLENES